MVSYVVSYHAMLYSYVTLRYVTRWMQKGIKCVRGKNTDNTVNEQEIQLKWTSKRKWLEDKPNPNWNGIWFAATKPISRWTMFWGEGAKEGEGRGGEVIWQDIGQYSQQLLSLTAVLKVNDNKTKTTLRKQKKQEVVFTEATVPATKIAKHRTHLSCKWNNCHSYKDLLDFYLSLGFVAV